MNEESAKKIVEEMIAIQLNDGMTFEIKRVASIMDEADYPGIRIMLETKLETMRTPLIIDFSAGDVITPRLKRRSSTPVKNAVPLYCYRMQI